MVKPRFYEYMLVGPTGQIGRHIFRRLVRTADICVLTHRPIYTPAQMLAYRAELNALVTPVQANSFGVWRGAPHEWNEQIVVKHVINAAGITSFGATSRDYVQNNVQLTEMLARYSQSVGATLHQLSSFSVAYGYQGQLAEDSPPVQHGDGMNLYTLSKVVSEATAKLTCDSTRIYRICDVVPDGSRMAEDFRRSHWIALALKYARYSIPNDYPLRICTAAEAADAVCALAEKDSGQMHHILGLEYAWLELISSLVGQPVAVSDSIKQIVRSLVCSPPLASTIGDQLTRSVLERLGIQYSRLNEAYWSQYASQAMLK